MTPLGRLVERATRLPEVLVQMILEEVYRARTRRQEAARTIQTASMRPAFLQYRRQRARLAAGQYGEPFLAWFTRVPRRYQLREFEGREEQLDWGPYILPAQFLELKVSFEYTV